MPDRQHSTQSDRACTCDMEDDRVSSWHRPSCPLNTDATDCEVDARYSAIAKLEAALDG